MKRADFIRLSTLAGLAPVCAPLFSFAGPAAVTRDEELIRRLVTANDQLVAVLLNTVQEGKLNFSRKTAYDFAILSGSFCEKSSVYYHDPRIISRLEILARFLTSSQGPDGTLNIGNLESPPDTAFVIEIVTTATTSLQQQSVPELKPVLDQIRTMILNAGEALRTGGIHTPNHRWVICAALSQIHSLYPDKKYVTRINEWMAEGIYQDADGYYPERSGTYSMVENTAFITMARNLKRPELLKYVRKNLNTFYYNMEANGDLV